MGAALPILSIVGSAASGVFGAVGQVQQGQAVKAQSNYQAAIARNNAILARRAADDAIARCKTAEELHRSKVKQFIARQRTAAAAAGVEVDTGSALDATLDSAMYGELDALTIRDNATREAAAYTAQGQNFRAEEQLYKARAQSAGGLWGAAGSLLSGATSVADKWYQFKKEGVFGGSTAGTSTFGRPAVSGVF